MMRWRDLPTLAHIWWMPLVGVACLVVALMVHEHHIALACGGDNGFEITLAGGGCGLLSRANRARHVTKNRLNDPDDEFLTGPKKPVQRPKWAD